jgi:hypothetical protein
MENRKASKFLKRKLNLASLETELRKASLGKKENVINEWLKRQKIEEEGVYVSFSRELEVISENGKRYKDWLDKKLEEKGAFNTVSETMYLLESKNNWIAVWWLGESRGYYAVTFPKKLFEIVMDEDVEYVLKEVL